MRRAFMIMLVFCIIICGISVAARSEAARRVSFPLDGTITGDYVRYRSAPSTNSRIYGRLFRGDEVTVIGQRTVRGQLWYEIYDPNSGDRTAWVAARYIVLDLDSYSAYH